MQFDKKWYEREFKIALSKNQISKSNELFKIKFFVERAENSLLIAEFHKNIVPEVGQAKKLHWSYWSITISYYSMLYAAKAAILSKGYEVHGHDAAQVALGHLLVPSVLEKEDLELLNESYRIFEEEYIHFFEDAKKESFHARYRARKSYTDRRLEEIFEKANNFVTKIKVILEKDS
jgi:uncharacterized protein (UPF0332 family)